MAEGDVGKSLIPLMSADSCDHTCIGFVNNCFSTSIIVHRPNTSNNG